MINFLILPILIPLVSGIILIFFVNRVIVQRIFSFIASLVTMIFSWMLVEKVRYEGIQTVNLGSWDAPYGITLVTDMLSALLVLTTSIIAFTCLIYAFRTIGEDREKFYFYPVFQFLVVGVNGAFTTGDIFNLFVFFEVMLMASYVLIVLGGTKIQLQESLKYILVNIISSALFVITVAYLYSVVGTLNMAHISLRISEVGQTGIITVIAVLFLIVFGLKGAIFPLFFWLPGSYYAPPVPVMALFGALLTKVGVYSIIRSYSLFFHQDTEYTHQILIGLAILTIIFGGIGAVAFSDIKKIIIYNILVAVGVILFGFAVMTPVSITGSIFYLIHDMIIKAALFLLIGIMISITGTSNLTKISGLIKNYPGLAWTYFLAAISLAGIPPFSGFIGKFLIVQGGFKGEYFVGASVVLLSSLLVLYSAMKIFINGFWGESRPYKSEKLVSVKFLLISPIILVTISILIGLGSETVYTYISQAAESLINPSVYIDAVLKE